MIAITLQVMFVLTREHQGSGHVPHVPDSKLWR